MPFTSCNTLATQEMFSWYPTKEPSVAVFNRNPENPSFWSQNRRIIAPICLKSTTRNLRCYPVGGMRAAEHWDQQPLTDVAILLSWKCCPWQTGETNDGHTAFLLYQHAGLLCVLYKYSRCWPATGLSQNYYGWLNWLTVTTERLLASEHHHQLSCHILFIILTHWTDQTINYSHCGNSSFVTAS